MNRSPDPTRYDVRVFAVAFVYCLLLAHLVTDESWRNGLLGAAAAYTLTVLHLTITRHWGSPDG